MKKLFTFVLALLVASSVSAQKLISHTTLLSKALDNRLEQTDYTDGRTTYQIVINVSDKVPHSVTLQYSSKDKMLSVLHYLYDFKKGDGYFIDLESVNGATALSFGDGYQIGTKDNIDHVLISRYALGKLLNGIGVSVNDKPSSKDKDTDDIYQQPSRHLF